MTADAVGQSICAQLGRCAYAMADELYGTGAVEDPCPYWRDCFNPSPNHDSRP
jgi:hypothetical protein